MIETIAETTKTCWSYVMYSMYIDDVRNPPPGDWVVVRSSNEALECVQKNGMPAFISFDHDLGGDDTTMVFLRMLAKELLFNYSNPPKYIVHSSNPVGKLNIISFMDSWKKSLDLT